MGVEKNLEDSTGKEKRGKPENKRRRVAVSGRYQDVCPTGSRICKYHSCNHAIIRVFNLGICAISRVRSVQPHK